MAAITAPWLLIPGEWLSAIITSEGLGSAGMVPKAGSAACQRGHHCSELLLPGEMWTDTRRNNFRTSFIR